MDRRIIKTKNAIRLSYFTLLKEKDGGKITISEIARRANIDRKTFYLHYDNPEDIVREYCREKVYSFTNAIEERITDPDETVSIELFFDVLKEMVLASTKLETFLTSLKDNSFFFNEIKDALVNSIMRDFSDAFNLTREQIIIYSDFYLAGIISAYRLWSDGKVDVSLEVLAEKIKMAILNGLEYVISGE